MKMQNDDLNIWEMNINNALGIVDVGIWDYDVIEDEAFWSEKTYEIFEINKDEVPTFQKVLDLIHPEDREHYLNIYHKALREKKSYKVKFRIYRKDGSVRKLSTYADVILDENREVVRVIGTTVDSSKQDLLNTQLFERVQEISNHYLGVGIWSTDMTENKILFCSKGVESICGYSYHEFIDNKVAWVDLIYPGDIKEYQVKQKLLKQGKKIKHYYRIVHKNGEIRWIQDETIPSFDMEGNLSRIDGIVTDISEQKKSEEKMTFLAHHDCLTGLPNRLQFGNELTYLIETSQVTNEKFAMMYLDMDGFKRVNDTFGHQIGDKLLKEISFRLATCISEQDLIARMGGDGFSVIIRHIEDLPQRPISIAEQMIAAIEEPFFIDNYEMYITISIGIAFFQRGNDDSITLIKKADSALYRAKGAGKNTYQIYTSSMEKEFLKEYHLERALRKAIERNEFLMHYQPKVEAKTGEIVGAEALIRWQHQDRMIPPGEFIPLAEETGIIFSLTDWTLRTVCEQIKRWEEMNVPIVPVSVNISPKRLLKNDWVETFLRIIDETKVNPEYLELELTESVLIENEESFNNSIQTLKNIGIKISIDDFGTGYSSLIYLRKFKVDTVKIDQYFIQNSLENEVPVAKYIINLSHDLNMNVVAEGVETEKQVTLLQQYGCDQLQGYYFSKPVPAEEYIKMVSGTRGQVHCPKVGS
ncbi:EAL domain-containing protein [Fredinandcohnia humi]